MNIMYAEYNIHHNSIDIATTPGYRLELDPKSPYYLLDISQLLHYNNVIFIFLRTVTQ